jgi:hypothetical protein
MDASQFYALQSYVHCLPPHLTIELRARFLNNREAFSLSSYGGEGWGEEAFTASAGYSSAQALPMSRSVWSDHAAGKS